MDKKIIHFTKTEINSVDGYKRFIESCKLQFPNNVAMRQGTLICLKSLLARIESARQSFLLLLSHNHIPEACIVAGSMLEIMSVFDFIESEKDTDKQWELVQNYITECSLSKIIDILKMDLIHKLKDKRVYNNGYMDYVRQVKHYGRSLLRTEKTTSECIKFLTSNKNTSHEKITFINANYKKSTPNKKAQAFINKIKIKHKDQEESVWLGFNDFYAEYNNAKHGNIFMWHSNLAGDGGLNMNYGNIADRCLISVFLMLILLDEKYKTIELQIDETK
jgi:hypothetical protein